MNQNKWLSRFIIGTFVTLYALVSVISTIHVIDFFELSNPYWLAVTLAIGFELGAAASLASLVILDKMNKTLVWALFITITLMQMQGNMYYAFTNLTDFQSWSELFNLIEEEPIFQKRVLAAVSGAILPLVALGFIKSLVDYIKPESEEEFTPEDSTFGSIDEEDMVPESDEEEILEDFVQELSDIIDEDESPEEEPIKEEWDEDHALDQVLNNMLDEFDEEEAKIWEATLNDGLEEESLLDLQDSMADQEPEPEGEDPFEAAKRKLARENMKDFIKQKRDGSNSSNRA